MPNVQWLLVIYRLVRFFILLVKLGLLHTSPIYSSPNYPQYFYAHLGRGLGQSGLSVCALSFSAARSSKSMNLKKIFTCVYSMSLSFTFNMIMFCLYFLKDLFILKEREG